MAATYTSRLNLAKPDRQDFVSVVNDINNNMQKIDDEAVARNQDIRWTNAVSISQFINDCESAMPEVKGIYYLGYINWSALENWGNIDFNGYVLGLYHTNTYKSIFIVASGGQMRIAKFAKINGTWNETPYQVAENRCVPDVQINTNFEGYGCVTDSGTKLILNFPMANNIPAYLTPVLVTGSRFSVKGISGTVGEFTNSNSVELVGNSNYSVSVSRKNDGGLLRFEISKTSGNFGVTNNTPVTCAAYPLNVKFT